MNLFRVLKDYAMRRIIGLLVLWIAGCASTPQATRERDAEAKQFGSSPATATVYVYRTSAAPDETVLWIDDRLIGATLPYSYFRVHLDAGRHVFTGLASDAGRLALETRPGEVYFVERSTSSGGVDIARADIDFAVNNRWDGDDRTV